MKVYSTDSGLRTQELGLRTYDLRLSTQDFLKLHSLHLHPVIFSTKQRDIEFTKAVREIEPDKLRIAAAPGVLYKVSRLGVRA